MLTNTATPARASSPVLVGTPGFLRSVASLFELSPAMPHSTAVHLWWLGAIIAFGAAARFWSLGAVSLHGDEETMALAVRHILIDGLPILPSGMFYPRGLTQLYLMALSVSIFGESEWALRLPSALCGVALIPIAYAAGRRFLRPNWNLALAASVALLPWLIADSHTARMYIFLVAAIMGSIACLFEWERTDRIRWLIAAAAVLIIGIDMHALAIASVLMFLAPGMLSGDLRKLISGAVAAAAVGVGFLLIDGWVTAQYPVPPPEFAASFGPPPWERSRTTAPFALTFQIMLWGAGLAIAFLALHAVRAVASRAALISGAALLCAGVCLQLALYYHLAALCYVTGAVIAHRFGPPGMVRRLLFFALGCGVLALIHVTLLASQAGSLMKLVGLVVGQPSVWPYVRVVQLSEAAGLLTIGVIVWGVVRLAAGARAQDYWLLAVLGVWAPLFALGLFAWNVPPRYTEMCLAPMLLCAFAGAQHISQALLERSRSKGRRWTHAAAAAATALCVINPPRAAAVVDSGYDMYPDHKGAAEFIRSQNITDEDVVLAEDILQQTYYLGRVDYWLIGGNIARKFVKRAEGGVVDFYTGTPVIATADMLQDLLQKNAGKRIFVIGSGEQQDDGRRGARGEKLHELLESPRFEVVHVGRDGLTRVLRASTEASRSSQSTAVQAKKDARALADVADARERSRKSADSDRAPHAQAE